MTQPVDIPRPRQVRTGNLASGPYAAVSAPIVPLPPIFPIPVPFGVEIEMSRLGLRSMHVAVSDALEVPTRCMAPPRWMRHDNVHDNRGEVWEVKIDCEDVNELATPILSTHEDLATLCRVAASLGGAGACTLGATGLHIHVDAASFMPRDVINLMALVAIYQRPLDAALQVRNERYGYCKLIDPGMVHILNRVRDLPRAEFCSMCLSCAGGRNRNVNLTNLVEIEKHTVEFRMFNATLDPTIIGHYVAMVMGVVGAAKGSVDFVQLMSRSEAPTLAQFCMHIGISPASSAGAYLLAQTMRPLRAVPGALRQSASRQPLDASF